MKILIFVGRSHDAVGGAAHHALTLFARPRSLEIEVLDAAERATRLRRQNGEGPVDWANAIEIDDTMHVAGRTFWKVAFGASAEALKRQGAIKVKPCANGEFVALFPEVAVNVHLGRAMSVAA